MVRMPGSSDEDQEMKIKTEPGVGLTSEQDGRPTSSAFATATAPVERQPLWGAAAAKIEEAIDEFENKPPAPLMAPNGATAVRDASCEPHGSETSATADSFLPTKPATKLAGTKKVVNKKKARVKMKTPRSDHDRSAKIAPDTSVLKSGSSRLVSDHWNLDFAFHRRELFEFIGRDPVLHLMQLRLIGDLTGPISRLPSIRTKLEAAKGLMTLMKEVGFVPGPFDPNELFEFEFDEIAKTLTEAWSLLSTLVGVADKKSASHAQHPTSRASSSESSSYQTGASRSESDTDLIPGTQRMTITPDSARHLLPKNTNTNVQVRRGTTTRNVREHVAPQNTVTRSGEVSEQTMEEIMRRVLQHVTTGGLQVPSASTQVAPTGHLDADHGISIDVDMESVGGEFDPDDLDITPQRMIAMTTSAPHTQLTAVPRVRMSAISDLKEFSGKDIDDDRARSWLGKVKSAIMRDQSSDEEKCLIFGGLLTGPARNWYRQLSRTTRGSWGDLIEQFQIQYCELGVSASRQYHHAKKRADESPLEYLYRLNV